jgi:hypothetical protein
MSTGLHVDDRESKDAAITFGRWLAAITFGRWLATADEVADRVEDGRLPLPTPGWLGVGDGVRIEVEEPGVIENRLVPGADPLPVPRGRRRIGVEVSAWN